MVVAMRRAMTCTWTVGGLMALSVVVSACDLRIEAPSVGDDAAFSASADAAHLGDRAPPRDVASRDTGTHDGAPHDGGAHDGGTHDAATAASLLPIPDSLLLALSARPYVEEHCTATHVVGWAHAAQRCTYGAGLVVTVADPSAERVARWIVEAAQSIQVVAALRARDTASYEACLVRIARHTMTQSSRIFPLAGQISEDVVYEFRDGVAYGYGSYTRTCRTCYCRIDSLSRAQWCAYEAGTGHGSEASCLSRYGGETGWNDAWASECVANHSAAFEADANEHYRAQAWLADRDLRARFPHPSTARGAEVLVALGEHYPIY
jgi:hypothetical protein